MISWISVLIILIAIPFIEHLVIFAGIFSIFGLISILYSERLDLKSFLIVIIPLSLILDVSLNYSLGTYLFSASISLLIFNLMHTVLPDLNIIVKYLLLLLSFFIFNLVLYIVSSLQLGLSMGEILTWTTTGHELLNALWGLPMYAIFSFISSYTTTNSSKGLLKFK